MKKLLAIIILGLVCLSAHAAPTVIITNWIPSYVSVVSATNTGDTGLNVGTNYICFAIGDILLLDTNQAEPSSPQVGFYLHERTIRRQQWTDL